uniref:Uncharacterized protein n=1 Tax=Mesocestoides corti TaxID=53468 RepID=A0A5K3F5G3_MESCO
MVWGEVEYPSPNWKKTGTTEQALLTNHKSEPHVKRLPSESATLATPPIIYCTSSVSFSGWLLIFLACYWIAERQRLAEAGVVQYVCALIRRYTTLRGFDPLSSLQKRSSFRRADATMELKSSKGSWKQWLIPTSLDAMRIAALCKNNLFPLTSVAQTNERTPGKFVLRMPVWQPHKVYICRFIQSHCCCLSVVSR